MINVKFYEDQEGYFKVDIDEQYQLIGQYFETEVQGIYGVCQDLLEAIKEIKTGDRTELEGVGNAYGLKLTIDTVTIWNEFSETELILEISLADFTQALENCVVFLQSK
jgi:uncharacterized protein YacL (UPF0231 family)